MLVHRFHLPPNEKGTVLFEKILKQRKRLKFEFGPPDSTQSTEMAVSECPESGRVRHEQADDNVVTINKNKGKPFTVLGNGPNDALCRGLHGQITTGNRGRSDGVRRLNGLDRHIPGEVHRRVGIL
jgi:hypothetical protein